ncbi:MAG: hypothetical protein ACTHXO_05000 [Actinomycetaceae bacterium]
MVGLDVVDTRLIDTCLVVPRLIDPHGLYLCLLRLRAQVATAHARGRR